MNETLRLEFSVVIPAEAIELLKRVVTPPADRKLEASRNAIFAGQKPSEDFHLLLDTRRLSKMLGFSPRKIFEMHRTHQMPTAIKVGRATRWNLNEIKAWIDAGCPDCSTWKWDRKLPGEKQV